MPSKVLFYNLALESKLEWTKSPAEHELAPMFLALIHAQAELKQKEESRATMSNAMRIFAGTNFENLFTIAKGTAAMKEGDIQVALDLFSSIQHDDPYLELIQ